METYDKAEMLTSFRRAKDKKNQILILAELNQCKVSEVRDQLLAAGASAEEIPEIRGLRKTRPAAGRPPKDDDVEKTDTAAENNVEKTAEQTVDSTVVTQAVNRAAGKIIENIAAVAAEHEAEEPVEDPSYTILTDELHRLEEEIRERQKLAAALRYSIRLIDTKKG